MPVESKAVVVKLQVQRGGAPLGIIQFPQRYLWTLDCGKGSLAAQIVNPLLVAEQLLAGALLRSIPYSWTLLGALRHDLALLSGWKLAM